MTFQALKIDHLGIAVRSIEETMPFYTSGVKLEVIHDEIVPDQMVRTLFLKVGESCVELLEPTSPESPVAKFLEKKGPGIHHVAYAVTDIEAALQNAREQGYRLIDEKPRKGSHNKLIAFIHPKDSFGVLTEFCQQL